MTDRLVGSIDGIGEEKAQRLCERGVTTIDEFVRTPVVELEEVDGLGLGTILNVKRLYR